jgi:DNA-binding transcriptional ArsR family regulator
MCHGPPATSRRKIVVQRDAAVLALSALAQEVRLELVNLLVANGPDGLPAGIIAERLGVPPASLSFHFQQLLRAGLVTQRRRSRYVIYAANRSTMDRLLAYLDARWQRQQQRVEATDCD